MLICEYSGGQLFQRELVVLNSTYMMIRPIGDIACYMAVRNVGGNSEQKMAVGASAKDPHTCHHGQALKRKYASANHGHGKSEEDDILQEAGSWI